MIPKTCLTRASLKSGERYPAASIHWERDADELGVSGTMTIYSKAGKPQHPTHKVAIRQSTPLGGGLLVIFDGLEHGAWAFADVPVEDLTVRDLHWATAWAVQAWKHRTVVTEWEKEGKNESA